MAVGIDRICVRASAEFGKPQLDPVQLALKFAAMCVGQNAAIFRLLGKPFLSKRDKPRTMSDVSGTVAPVGA